MRVCADCVVILMTSLSPGVKSYFHCMRLKQGGLDTNSACKCENQKYRWHESLEGDNDTAVSWKQQTLKSSQGWFSSDMSTEAHWWYPSGWSKTKRLVHTVTNTKLEVPKVWPVSESIILHLYLGSLTFLPLAVLPPSVSLQVFQHWSFVFLTCRGPSLHLVALLFPFSRPPLNLWTFMI